MSYVTTVSKSCANRAAGLTEIWSQLSSMGWTLHDNQDGSSYRVYSSAAESGTEPVGYIKITFSVANTIVIAPYYYWNNSTHVGLGTNPSAATSVTTSETGFYLWIYGDKNYVVIFSKVTATYYTISFGHFVNRFWNTQTALTVAATSGSAVTITVADTTGFIAGQSYQIYGIAAEGRDKVVVTSITNPTQMVITTLPRNYGIGTLIGQLPCTFGAGGGVSFYEHSGFAAVGTADYSSVQSQLMYLNASSADVRGLSAYVLQPLAFANSTAAAYTWLGYINDNVFRISATAAVAEDTVDVVRQDTGTATSGGASSLTDTGKTWTTNAFAGKVAIITFGTGIGQIRGISSNTATILTTLTPWTLAPDATSQYIIADEGYRVCGLTTLVCREGI